MKFLVYALPHLMTLTEDQVRAAMFGDERDRADVLALEIGEQHVCQGGAEFTRVEDDAEPVNAIVCVRGRRRRKCAFCSKEHTLLCDFKAGGKTCDKPLCRDHAQKIAKNIDYCHTHPAEASRG